MTLVYSQDRTGPKTHALVIGCGRFPYYSSNINRPATVAGARAMVEFLRGHADNLVAPLGSIELLLSDPAVSEGQDALPQGPFDPRADTSVNAATRENARNAGKGWLARFAPDDHLLFYMSSHGVVDNALSAIALLEDFYSNVDAPFAEAIDVGQLGGALSSKPAGAYWVFLDACQEVTELVEQPDGSGALMLLTPSVRKLANPKGPPGLCLAGSRLGGRAWAPDADQPPFFTQALIDAMTHCGVTQVPQLGWVVTGQRLIYDLAKVADAALGILGLETEPLRSTSRDPALVKITSPDVPVVVRTEIEAHLAGLELEAFDSARQRVSFKARGQAEWRFRVPADGAKYRVEPIGGGDPAYSGHDLDADPVAQIVNLALRGAPPSQSPVSRPSPASRLEWQTVPASVVKHIGADTELVGAVVFSGDPAPSFAVGLSAVAGQVDSNDWHADTLPFSIETIEQGLAIRFERPDNWRKRPLWRLTLSVSGDPAVRVQLPLLADGITVRIVRVASPKGGEVAVHAEPNDPILGALLETVDRLGPNDTDEVLKTLVGVKTNHALLADRTAARDPWTMALAALLVARGSSDPDLAMQTANLAVTYSWLPDFSVAAAWIAAATATEDSIELDARCLYLLRGARRPYFGLASRMGLELLATLEAGSVDAKVRREAGVEADRWRRQARQSLRAGPFVTWVLDGRALDKGELGDGFATIVEGRVTARGLVIADERIMAVSPLTYFES